MKILDWSRERVDVSFYGSGQPLRYVLSYKIELKPKILLRKKQANKLTISYWDFSTENIKWLFFLDIFESVKQEKTFIGYF